MRRELLQKRITRPTPQRPREDKPTTTRIHKVLRGQKRIRAAHHLGKKRGLWTFGFEQVLGPRPRAPEPSYRAINNIRERDALGRRFRQTNASDRTTLERRA